MSRICKKILLLHSSNDLYGSSKIFLQIVQILVKKGYEIHLILPGKGPLDEIIDDRICLKHFNLGVLRKKYLNPAGLLNRLLNILKAIRFLSEYIKFNKINLVYTNTSTILAGAIAAKKNKIPSLFHIHEIPESNSIYAGFMTTFLNNFSRNIVCVSKSVKDFWIQKGVKKNKLEIINNGFILKKTKPKVLNKEKIIFTSISRIIPYKGHILLIELFDALFKKNNKIQLQIVGDTLPQYQKYLDDLKLNIKKKGIDDRIMFLGFRNDISCILNNSNFFIHTPILPDPFPTVIFEAIQAKIPVVTNDLGGAYEILNNGKNGLIIKNDLISESVDKISTFIENQQLQKENTEIAFDYVSKNFTLENFEKKIIRIIE